MEKEGNMAKTTKNGKKHLHPMFRSELTLGQKASDALTKFAGSWTFIILFGVFLVLWMCANAYFLIRYTIKPFDPYPFILLNLILSCLAAIQAPIILMSQNREAQRDRIRAEYDFRVNRKAEKEIRELQQDIKYIKRFLKEGSKNRQRQ
jgi:uncharacterized membrane protein